MMRFILSALKSGYDIQNVVVISSDNNLLLIKSKREWSGIQKDARNIPY